MIAASATTLASCCNVAAMRPLAHEAMRTSAEQEQSRGVPPSSAIDFSETLVSVDVVRSSDRIGLQNAINLLRASGIAAVALGNWGLDICVSPRDHRRALDVLSKSPWYQASKLQDVSSPELEQGLDVALAVPIENLQPGISVTEDPLSFLMSSEVLRDIRAKEARVEVLRILWRPQLRRDGRLGQALEVFLRASAPVGTWSRQWRGEVLWYPSGGWAIEEIESGGSD